MNTHNNTTTTQYATHFYNINPNQSITYQGIASCDIYPTHAEATAWGQQLAGGLHDGFVIVTVTQ